MEIKEVQQDLDQEVVDVFEYFWSYFSYFKAIVIGSIPFVIHLIFICIFVPMYVIFWLCILPCIPVRETCFDTFRIAIWTVFTRFWNRCVMVIFGYYWVFNKGTLYRKGSRIMVCNHTSLTDIMYLAVVYFPSFVVAEFVSKAPLIGNLSRLNRAFVIHRVEGGLKKVEDPKVPPMIIFPEGTTSNGTHITHFKSGAFSPGLPVHPLCFVHHYFFCDPTWSLYFVIRHCAMMMAQFINSLTLYSLPVYHPSPAEIAHPKYYAWNVKNAIARASGLSISYLSLREKNNWEKKRSTMKLSEEPRPINRRKELRDQKKKQKKEQEQAMKNNPDQQIDSQNEIAKPPGEFDPLTHYIPKEAYDYHNDQFYSNAVEPPPEILAYIELLGSLQCPSNYKCSLPKQPASMRGWSPYKEPDPLTRDPWETFHEAEFVRNEAYQLDQKEKRGDEQPQAFNDAFTPQPEYDRAQSSSSQ
ncbi:MAG: putative lysophospholipid acyltransferase LPEAT1 [Streblomastix strix]|uniref:Putative lysophospholipid acyltransferase LPEAT1 n=1 Tax=Streblomastix strix TaxID=222440 RepID=A0A5J4WCC1_9EUKA|nr:MAG: putative lysophospholipid acyltransferase LPEAT1 [Streblomastix strix]